MLASLNVLNKLNNILDCTLNSLATMNVKSARDTASRNYIQQTIEYIKSLKSNIVKDISVVTQEKNFKKKEERPSNKGRIYIFD